MSRLDQLDRSFFERNTAEVAQDLLGRILVRTLNGDRLAGRIVETEAYSGFEDAASHAYGRMTPRNAVMFGLSGISYIYFIYGKYWMLNVIAKPRGVEYPAAILIRAVEPVEGLEIMATRRSERSQREWTNGPARLVLALGIDPLLNGIDMTAPDSPLHFEAGEPVLSSSIRSGARVGLGQKVPEPWKSHPWRFWVDGSPYISK
jgi:DNA-3-methyladenine glycosylase